MFFLESIQTVSRRGDIVLAIIIISIISIIIVFEKGLSSCVDVLYLLLYFGELFDLFHYHPYLPSAIDFLDNGSVFVESSR